MGRFDAIVLGFVVALAIASAAGAQDAVTRVSVDSSGTQGNGDSSIYPPAISGDGRWIAFDSLASNLVAGDRNSKGDVFVHDRLTATTVRVSVSSSGGEGNGWSAGPAMTPDGRYVAFWSFATNLVASDTNAKSDIFLHDRDPDGDGIFDQGNGVTVRVSVSSSGAQANGNCDRPALSDDGTIVSFDSVATNLVSGDTNGVSDVFVRDVAAGTTTRVSVDSGGGEHAGYSVRSALSADGNIVAFESVADALVQGDLNGFLDVFVRDRAAGTTEIVSVDSYGTHADNWSFDAALSADGNLVTFESWSDHLVTNDTNGRLDVFVHDRATGITTQASVDSTGAEGPYTAYYPSLSADGNLVLFSTDNFFDPRETGGLDDVYLHDRTTGVTRACSTSRSGVFGDEDSRLSAISADGRVVVWTTRADNLVANDTNSRLDVFVLDTALDATWSNYGAGLPGTLGVPALTASAPPVFGYSITVDLGNSRGAPTLALLLLGLDSAAINTSAGGTLLVDELLQIPVPLAIGVNSLPWDVPLGDSSLCGITLYLQALERDPGAAYGLSFSAGLALALGLG